MLKEVVLENLDEMEHQECQDTLEKPVHLVLTAWMDIQDNPEIKECQESRDIMGSQDFLDHREKTV